MEKNVTYYHTGTLWGRHFLISIQNCWITEGFRVAEDTTFYFLYNWKML